MSNELTNNGQLDLHLALRYKYACKATRDIVYDWDILQDKLVIEDTITEQLGYKLKSYNLKWWNELLHPDDKSSIVCSLETFLNNWKQQHWHGRYRMKKADGSWVHIDENGYVIRDLKGKAVRMIGVVRDITQRVHYQETIEEQNKRLKEIVRMQSHDVRAPLARIMALCEKLAEEDNRTSDKEIINNILNSASELDNVIKKICLDAESGQNRLSTK